MYNVKEISFQEMDDLLYYDETSKTCLRWKKNRCHARADAEAGYITSNNKEKAIQFWQVMVNQKAYLAHRVVFLLHNGNISSDIEIDHYDGNELNNKISNLRSVTRVVNNRNHKKRSDNTTGIVGVSYNKQNNRYLARWSDETGHRKAKYFSCNKCGTELAFKLACEYRKQMILEINNRLGSLGYTDRHGT